MFFRSCERFPLKKSNCAGLKMKIKQSHFHTFLAIVVTGTLTPDYVQCSPVLNGPLSFSLQAGSHHRIMDKANDKCAEIKKIPISTTYKVGPDTFDSLVICEDGYVVPHVSGDAIPAVLNDASDFDTVSFAIIAAGLMNYTRLDNLIDIACLKHFEYPSYFVEPICNVASIAYNSSFLEGSTSTQLTAIQYDLQPSYDPTATNAFYLVNIWRNALTNNIVNYYEIAASSSSVATGFKAHLFSTAENVQRYEITAVNNIFVRSLTTASDESVVHTILSDSNFRIDWSVCVSWYKITRPPQITEGDNTFQLVLACMDATQTNTSATKCVTIFDYFGLEALQEIPTGSYLRAGLNGPNFGK